MILACNSGSGMNYVTILLNIYLTSVYATTLNYVIIIGVVVIVLYVPKCSVGYGPFMDLLIVIETPSCKVLELIRNLNCYVTLFLNAPSWQL